MTDMVNGVVISNERIQRFEVVTARGESDMVEANKFFHDGLLIHFWLTDYTKMRDVSVLAVRADWITSIRPVYAEDAGKGGE